MLTAEQLKAGEEYVRRIAGRPKRPADPRADPPRWIRHRRRTRIGTRPGRDTTRQSRYMVRLPNGADMFCASSAKKTRMVKQFSARVTKVHKHNDWAEPK